MRHDVVIHRVRLPIVFPAGVSVGAQRDGNLVSVTRTATGELLVQGTTWAGSLRAALRDSGMDERELSHWMGSAASVSEGHRSRITVHDAVLEGHAINRRHIQVDRHDGAPVDGGLFEVEAAAPGSHCELEFWVAGSTDEAAHIKQLVETIINSMAASRLMGGSKARGIGRAQLNAKLPIVWHSFDLSSAEDHGRWLDVLAGHEPKGATAVPHSLAPAGAGTPGTTLVIDLELSIPPGQDLLVADGKESLGDAVMRFQRVSAAGDVAMFRLPGSTLRGLFRAWCSRLAARHKMPVAYSVAVRENERWEGADHAVVKPADCAITDLFGSSEAAGRIHVSDALIPVKDGTEQRRTHVSIDHAWAVSKDGMLFSNDVLLPSRQPFAVRLSIRDVKQHEAEWVGRTLRALDIGLIRVGSSKSAGRLSVSSCRPQGAFAVQVSESFQSKGATRA